MSECAHPADAVFWNDYNGVTQCHRCGTSFCRCGFPMFWNDDGWQHVDGRGMARFRPPSDHQAWA